MITKNEESCIARALESVVHWCDDIVVVDSNSQDRTIEIAKQYGARTFFKDFKGYGEQKHYAVEQAKNDWVIILDADEVVTPELKSEILSLDLTQSKYVAYRFEQLNIFLQKRLRFFGRGSTPIRIFNKRYAQYNNALVHEDVVTEGRIFTLRGGVDHYSYRDVHQYFDKFNKYTSFGAEEMFKEGKRVSGVNIVVRWLIAWFRFYIIKGGFMNGYAGFVWCFLSGFYTAVKYIKLKELNDRAKQ